MRRLPRLVAVVATTAMAISALGAPVSAIQDAFPCPPGGCGPSGTLNIVNGIPGKTVDVCIKPEGQTKTGVRLRYGQKMVNDANVLAGGLPVGEYVLKIKAPGNDGAFCQGKLLAKEGLTMNNQDVYTAVAQRTSGTDVNGVRQTFYFWTLFDNNEINGAEAATISGGTIIVNHAALGKIGRVDGYVAAILNPSDLTPTVQLKRYESAIAGVPAGGYSVWVTKPGKEAVLIGPKNKRVNDDQSNNYVAVGNKKSNAKLVFFRNLLNLVE